MAKEAKADRVQCYCCEEESEITQQLVLKEKVSRFGSETGRVVVPVCNGCYALLSDLGTVGPVREKYLTLADEVDGTC